MKARAFAGLVATAMLGVPIAGALAQTGNWRMPHRPYVGLDRHPYEGRQGRRPVSRCDVMARQLHRFRTHLRHDGRTSPDELRVLEALRADYRSMCGG